jgi:hypothetical protein
MHKPLRFWEKTLRLLGFRVVPSRARMAKAPPSRTYVPHVEQVEGRLLLAPLVSVYTPFFLP